MEIWEDAIKVSDELFDIAEQVEKKRYYRFAEQFRAAGMSISNNISEGSGSFSDKDFANFLNISRRSIFECANILFILHKRKLIDEETRNDLLSKLDLLSRKITNFRKSLL